MKEDLMTSEEFEICKKIFIFDEGRKLIAYKDSLGNWTIGIGHLLPDQTFKDFEITETICDEFFRADIVQAITDCCIIFGKSIYWKLTFPRKIALLTLAFTLGRKKLSKFTETISAIKAGKFSKASDLILHTKWASDVDPKRRLGKGRDDRVAYMLKTGEFHPEYNIKEATQNGSSRL